MRIAITGTGQVSPLGIGRSLGVPLTLSGCRIDLDRVRAGLPKRGLGFLNRATVLALRAATDAVAQASGDRELPEPRGLVVGTSRPHHESIRTQFEHYAQTNEIRLILGLNGGINALAARLAIRFQTRAFAFTVPTDCAAGLDAILEAARLLRAGRAASVIAGGVESAALEKRDDVDAAAFMVLEAVDDAGSLDHRAVGSVLGWAVSGAPRDNEPQRLRQGIAVIRRALAAAGREVTRVLTSGGAGEEEAAAAVLGARGLSIGPLLESSISLGLPIGAFQVLSAVSSDEPGPTLVMNFAPGKLLAAVVEGREADAAARKLDAGPLEREAS